MNSASSTPALSLHELALRIGGALEAAFPKAQWVVAEVADIDIKKNGHCYLTLIERSDEGIQAQMRGTIWSFQYKRIAKAFRTAAGSDLSLGMKILFACEVSFHERWGLSLNITDIDPTYTLGEMARRRMEIVARLKAEGLIDLNRQLAFPLVPQRIAIISSETAAGYRDFMHELQDNRYDYKYATVLYQAAMQGDQTEASVIRAMEEIEASSTLFDVIVIIRGGGSIVDLSSFDSYAIGRAIAQSSIPVMTGIGHEEDETVADLVAHMSCKTPTKVAETIVSLCRKFEERVDELMQELSMSCRRLGEAENQKLMVLIQKLQVLSLNRLANERAREATIATRLKSAACRLLETQARHIDQLQKALKDGAYTLRQQQWQKMDHFDQTVRLLDPENTLKRGFSITYFVDRSVKDVKALNIGSQLKTRLYRGTVISRIESMED